MENIDIKKLEKSVFNTLYDIDTRSRSVEKDTGKTKLNYLPWATVYSEVCKKFDDVQYKFLRQEVEVEETTTKTLDDGTVLTTTRKYTDELPYFQTESGLEVRTEVTVNGTTKEMSLPVYDPSYKSMGFEPYTYSTKYGDKTVQAAHFDDIYKSIMRCFAKNLSMFGVGLNMWTREDAPERVLEIERLQDECVKLIQAKSSLSEKTTTKVGEMCKDILPDENGDPRLCDDVDKLSELSKRLKTIRKVV